MFNNEKVIGYKSKFIINAIRIAFAFSTLALLMVSTLYVIEIFDWVWGVAIAAVPFAFLLIFVLATRKLNTEMIAINESKLVIIGFMDIELININEYTIKFNPFLLGSLSMAMVQGGVIKIRYLKNVKQVAKIIEETIYNLPEKIAERVTSDRWNAFVNWAYENEFKDLETDIEKVAKYIYELYSAIFGECYQDFFLYNEDLPHEKMLNVVKEYLPEDFFQNHMTAFNDFKKDEFKEANRLLETNEYALYPPNEFIWENDQRLHLIIDDFAKKILEDKELK